MASKNGRRKARALRRVGPRAKTSGWVEACGKQSYQTHIEAKLAAARFAMQGDLTRAYRCYRCYRYHLTSRLQKNKRDGGKA